MIPYSKNEQRMTWPAFRRALTEHPELHLQFRYGDEKWVEASYHITEIKQAVIQSVDCGGVKNAWTEVVLQLWEPEGAPAKRPMTAEKALSIITLVESALDLDPDALVKIEYGHAGFDARQMYPGSIHADGRDLVIDLRADATQCKAIERGGSCGTTPSGEACCAPAEPKVSMINLAAPAASCEPGSGCC